MTLKPALARKPRAVFDTECTSDYWLIYFKCVETGRKKYFEFFEGHPLDRVGLIKVMRSFTLVGFNSMGYDIPMLKAALLQGMTNQKLKKINDAIINRRLKPWVVEREFNLPEIPWLDHIDLIEPSPGVQIGLKLYGGRLHSKRLQELPFDPNGTIFGADAPPGMRETTIRYCENDLDTTLDLYKHIEPQINLRCDMGLQYGIDVRSKSDAQIAEAVIRHELERIKGDKIYKPELPHDYSFQYQTPHFIKFKTEQMKEILRTIEKATFVLSKKEVKDDDADADDASTIDGVKVKISGVAMPKEIKGLRIKMGASTYKMGIGGLHSMEKRISHYATAKVLLRDADVSAFYPALILICGLYPEHLGPEFLEIYRNIRDRRMGAKEQIRLIKKAVKMLDDALEEAKLRGDLAAATVIDMTLKIVLNGTFGKLGSKWSFLFAPNLMIQVTITGQLVLLMLIERLELAGISVISANTDGIVCRIPIELEDTYHDIIKQWEAETGFEMEFADYTSLHSMSVNSYVAVKPDGTVKQKGLCAFVGSKGSPAEKNPTNYICTDAVIAYLTKGTPLEETIEWCPDIRRFLTVRRVRDGALFRGEYLGKVTRWYHARGSRDCIQYAKGDKLGHKVPKSDGARPLMELDGTLPSDIDYDYYKSEAVKMLGELGVL